MSHGYRCLLRLRVPRFALLLVITVLFPSALPAQQDLVSVGDSYITASVVLNPTSQYGGGRFVIDAGSAAGGYRFLYFITSCVVFRVVDGGNTWYHTNAKPMFGGQPMVDANAEVPYTPFDSATHVADTIVVYWRNLHGFAVAMRFFPDKLAGQYARGNDMIVEFNYHRTTASAQAEFGVFMMLDCYNGQAEGAGGGGDKSSVITDVGYFPTTGNGKVFKSGVDTLPSFYHVGNFLYSSPINNVLPIHRLQGISHGGFPITPPDQFAIGNWRRFRTLGWDLDLGGLLVGDAATAMRWQGLRDSGTVRTAFGLDDRDANNLYHCRNNRLFLDIRTIRLAEQAVAGGQYSPSAFDVQTWVTNTDTVAIDVALEQHLPQVGAPLYGLLAIDASTPAIQTLHLAPHATGQLRWRMNVAVTDGRTVDYPLDIRYRFIATDPMRVLSVPCQPIVTLRGVNVPPPADTLPPVIALRSASSDSSLRQFTVSDVHPGYLFDTGLDTITVQGTAVNMTVSKSVPVRCDTASTSNVQANVPDKSKAGYAVLRVTDCAGNVALREVRYAPIAGADRPQSGSGALAIVGLGPLPIALHETRALRLDVVGLTARGANAELIAMDGGIAATFTIEANASGSAHVRLELPASVVPGVYMLRLHGGVATVSAKVVVVR